MTAASSTWTLSSRVSGSGSSPSGGEPPRELDPEKESNMSQDNEPLSECEVCGHRAPYSEDRRVFRVTWRTVTGPSGATEEEGITHCATCNPLGE